MEYRHHSNLFGGLLSYLQHLSIWSELVRKMKQSGSFGVCKHFMVGFFYPLPSVSRLSKGDSSHSEFLSHATPPLPKNLTKPNLYV